jgi:uncharacterized protein YfcZ (UPF0381/DUF406 family)
VKALAASEDDDVIPVLEKIAKQDKHVIRRKDKDGKVSEYYSVRELAEKELKKLREKLKQRREEKSESKQQQRKQKSFFDKVWPFKGN